MRMCILTEVYKVERNVLFYNKGVWYNKSKLATFNDILFVLMFLLAA